MGCIASQKTFVIESGAQAEDDLTTELQRSDCNPELPTALSYGQCLESYPLEALGTAQVGFSFLQQRLTGCFRSHDSDFPPPCRDFRGRHTGTCSSVLLPTKLRDTLQPPGCLLRSSEGQIQSSFSSQLVYTNSTEHLRGRFSKVKRRWHGS